MTAAKKNETADPLDATAPDHDPNQTGRMRLTEPQTVGEGDEERMLVPGTSMRVSADEALQQIESDPDNAALYGLTAEMGEALQEARKARAREAFEQSYSGTNDTSGGGGRRRRKPAERATPEE